MSKYFNKLLYTIYNLSLDIFRAIIVKKITGNKNLLFRASWTHICCGIAPSENFAIFAKQKTLLPHHGEVLDGGGSVWAGSLLFVTLE